MTTCVSVTVNDEQKDFVCSHHHQRVSDGDTDDTDDTEYTIESNDGSTDRRVVAGFLIDMAMGGLLGYLRFGDWIVSRLPWL